MEEVKTFNCHPDEEKTTIELYQDFGWTLFSNQEIRENDNYLERDEDGDLYSVRERRRTIKLTFKRDTGMPNYQEISQYEKEYFSKKNEIRREGGFASVVGIPVIVIVPLVLVLILHKIGLFGYLIPIFAFIILLLCRISGSKSNDETARRNSEIKRTNSKLISEMEEARQKSRGLCF